jgi:hypothetical protein
MSRMTIAALQNHAKDLEHRNNEGDSQLENLHLSLHRVQAHVAELANSILPVSSIPDEVLSIILQNDVTLGSLPSCLRQKRQALLRQICSPIL